MLKKDEENPEQLALKIRHGDTKVKQTNKQTTICCQSFVNCHLYWPGMGKAVSVYVTECFLVCHEVSAAATQLINYVLSQCTTGKNT